jgi:hypothetical protein
VCWVLLGYNNLSSFFAYKGPNTLQINNGFGFPISHIGSQIFQINNHFIILTNVLHVPQFSTNLINLSHLLRDNTSLSINFSSSCCIIKDFHIKIPPLQIVSINGLYTLKMKSLISHPQAFLDTRTTTSV